MKTPKFFELIASSKEGETDPRFRVFVELTDKDQDFWESQALGTPAGRDQRAAWLAGGEGRSTGRMETDVPRGVACRA